MSCKYNNCKICGYKTECEIYKENAELEKSCDETQELLDKQIEATYKLDKENAELIQENEEMKNGLGCETCQIHLEYMSLNNRIADLEKENAELKEKLEKETAHRIRNFNKAIEWKEKYRASQKENAELKEGLRDANEKVVHLACNQNKDLKYKLTKAKKLLRYYFDCFKNDNKYTLSDFEVVEDTEQFLSEVEK